MFLQTSSVIIFIFTFLTSDLDIQFDCSPIVFVTRMSGKVGRTPLFGQDGHLGIPLVVNSNKNIIQVCSKFIIIGLEL